MCIHRHINPLPQGLQRPHSLRRWLYRTPLGAAACYTKQKLWLFLLHVTAREVGWSKGSYGEEQVKATVGSGHGYREEALWATVG